MSSIDFVNPLQGTQSDYHFSTGNTLPLVGVPRGMTYWTPQTSDRNFIFDSRFPKLSGFRATHSPSPWMGDYGHFDVMPVVGTIYPTPEMRASAHSGHFSRPGLYKTHLVRYGIDVR